MPKQMHASIAVDLSGDEFVEAEEKLRIKPIWDEFITALNAAAIKFTHKRETIETRAKPAASGVKRTRRTAEQIAAEKAAAQTAAQTAMNAVIGERAG